MNYYLDVLKNKYAQFSGRARRSEYWYFTLVSFVISLLLMLIDTYVLGRNPLGGGVGIVGGLYSLAVLIPSIGVLVRRLHDTGRSGWWFFIVFIPIIGWIALLVFLFTDSHHGSNAYGLNPKGEGQEVTDHLVE